MKRIFTVENLKTLISTSVIRSYSLLFAGEARSLSQIQTNNVMQQSITKIKINVNRTVPSFTKIYYIKITSKYLT